ncbi:stress-activated map kinase-interacting protein-like protein [Acephala macrosclerotiorum]|nr:stress-activated map kinase-interacting protein-like protein [Acephala macrosclerotiorum]
MSVLQVEDLVSYQLRTNYLDTISDGVGERLITINDGFLNTAGFKAAGWRPNPANIKRTHSPPIPTAIASEYFQAPPRSAGLAPNGIEDELDEGGMVTGGAAGDTIGPGIATKRRRRREQMEEEDSSDLSDESDDDGDQRAAQQIKFSKMPIRNRSGSSPIRGSNLRQSSTVTSPSRTPGGQTRRGSQSALEAVKERARRDTVTSSEMSSENEFDASAFQRQREAARNAAKASKALLRHTSDPNVGVKRQQSDLLEEEEEDSDGSVSDMDSDFVGSLDSASMLDGVDGTVNASPTSHVVGTLPRDLQRSPAKKSKPAPPVLQALPPPRPISTIQPKSLLSAAIKAKRTKAAMPFESFASLSGQGDPNPLNLRIWAPFATSTTKPFEVLIRRSVHENEANDRAVTVADLVGLSLWRYTEEKFEPGIPPEKLNVNRWVLRMVEDEEVDYDFPALERNKPVSAFTTANNRAARSRSNSKPYDEFALVEATDEQFEQNQTVTPHFKQEAVASATIDDDMTPKSTPMPSSTLHAEQPRQNPLLTTMSALRQNSTLADAPTIGTTTAQTNARNGVKKFLRIHIHSADAAPGQMITLDVTTDTYLADVLDIVCKKRQLDKANHVLKMTGSGTVVLLDRTVESIGNSTELDLYRRRFATDGPLTMSGSPSSSSPKIPLMAERPDAKKIRKGPMLGTHPLAQEAIKQDELGSANYRKYTVWRKQPMRFVGLNERVLAIDGEYLHIMPASTGKTMFEGQGKTTTVHFSKVVGCKVTRRHPTNFKIVIYKTTETKRYDFEAKSADEAAEIVFEIKKGISPYHNV